MLLNVRRVLKVFLCLYALSACNLYESQGQKNFEERIEVKVEEESFFIQSFEPLCFVFSQKQAFSPFIEDIKILFSKKQFCLEFNSIYNSYIMCEKQGRDLF